MKRVLILAFILQACQSNQKDETKMWVVEATFHNGQKDTFQIKSDHKPRLDGYKTNGELLGDGICVICEVTYATGVRSIKILK